MAQNDFSGRSGAKRDAGTSDECRDVPEGSFCSTEGRVLLRRGVVARLYRYTVSLCGVRLAPGTRRVPTNNYIHPGCKQPGAQNHPGQMVLPGRKVL